MKHFLNFVFQVFNEAALSNFVYTDGLRTQVRPCGKLKRNPYRAKNWENYAKNAV